MQRLGLIVEAIKIIWGACTAAEEKKYCFWGFFNVEFNIEAEHDLYPSRWVEGLALYSVGW